MNKYDDGKIYLLYILGLEDEVCYVGSTCKDLERRYLEHSRSDNICKSKLLFEDGNIVMIRLLEDYPCNNKKELLLREKYWIKQFPNCINKANPIKELTDYYNGKCPLCGNHIPLDMFEEHHSRRH